MLKSGRAGWKVTYPMPKIFRSLLYCLAASGEVDFMLRIGLYLLPTKGRSELIMATADFIENRFWRSMMG